MWRVWGAAAAEEAKTARSLFVQIAKPRNAAGDYQKKPRKW